MILYVNGDSHCAGHGIVTQDVIASQHADLHQTAVRDNLLQSFGGVLAHRHGWDLVCQARSGGSVDRCIRTTRNFLNQTVGQVFVLIGVSSIEREEWFHEGTYYAVNGGGHDTMPEALRDRYKQWVADLSNFNYYHRQIYVHGVLEDFHVDLMRQGVPHLFFNTAQSFQAKDKKNPDRFNEHNWRGQYLDPYGPWDDSGQFTRWCTQQGFESDYFGHFGADAHLAWADHIEPFILDQL